LDHLWNRVATRVVRIDGVPHDEHYEPIWSYNGLTRFYVCPRTGLLRMARREPPRVVRPDPDVREISTLAQYRRVDGVWYYVVLARVPEDHLLRTRAYDVLL